MFFARAFRNCLDSSSVLESVVSFVVEVLALVFSFFTVLALVYAFALIFWPRVWLGLVYLGLFAAMFEVFRRSVLYIVRFFFSFRDSS